MTELTERTRRLRDAMTADARALTARHGLSGFTIEHLCEQVGVSRRTFFNHFRSKEDCVVGIEIDADESIVHDFADGGVVPLQGSLVAQIVAAVRVQLDRYGITREQGRAFKAALDREPALLARALASGDDQAKRLAVALRTRAGLAESDRTAALAVAVAGAVIRSAADEYFADVSSSPLEQLLAEHLRVAESVTSTTSPVASHQEPAA